MSNLFHLNNTAKRINWNTGDSHAHTLPFVLSLVTMHTICLYFPSSHNLYLYTLIRFPRKAFFSKFQELSSCLSLPYDRGEGSNPLFIFLAFCSTLVQYAHICIVLWSQQLDTALQKWSHQFQIERIDHFLAMYFLTQPRILLAFLLQGCIAGSSSAWKTISTSWSFSAKLFTSGEPPAFTHA